MATTHGRDDGIFVGGRWEAADDAIDVTDLADGGTFASVAAASPAQADAALAAADGARERMRESTVVERAEWLAAIADGIEARREELAEVVVREAGKPIASARGEVDAAAERFRRAVAEARSLDGDYREGTTDGHEGWEAIVKPEPVGVVVAVTPYNYPLSTTALHVAPALAAGNPVVVKPASETPVSATILAEVVAETALPDGGVNVVPGRSGTVGDLLVGDDRVDAVAMTGSTAAGEHVARESGMVDLHMELGGNAPAVVFPDADLDATADACAAGAFTYAGQRCSAVSRVLAHASVHDDLVAALVDATDDWTPGDLFDESTRFGPLVSHDQADWVVELVDDAVARGAELVAGGGRDGRVVEPTVLAAVPHDARILREEQFGPVAAVASFESERQAVALANDTDLALDAAVFTSDHDRAMRVADAVEAGAVRINGAPSHGIGDVPFGGQKASGIGREGLGYSAEAFTTTKSIVL
jgi:glyceraldehyde-3-phosphate dehydrogenase [NAD(P)+]